MLAWLRILAIILFPLQLLYTFIIYLRNKFYDWKWIRATHLPAPVISIGNIQLGGTGKTPLVQWLANYLQNEGYQPVILSRGYKRQQQLTVIIHDGNRDSLTAAQVGDEPLMLARNLPGVIIAVDANRQRAAQEVLKKKSEVVFILDDGFQHRKLARQFDIVLVDTSRWSPLPILFPLTSFRDLPASLKRAQAIILLTTDDEKQNIQKWRESIFSQQNIPVFFGQHKPVALRSVSGDHSWKLGYLKNKKIVAFCGIAQPTSFFTMLKNLEAQLVWRKIFPDHHAYRQKDIEFIWENATVNGAEGIITTHKDAVKIASLPIPSAAQWYFLQIDFDVAPQSEFYHLLKSRIKGIERKN